MSENKADVRRRCKCGI